MRLKYIIPAMALTLTLTGCNEDSFLDIKPQGTLSNSSLANAEGAEMLTTAAYAALRQGDHWTPMTNWTYGEVRSDNAYKGGGGTGDGEEAHRLEIFDIDATWGNADSKWFQLYCNLQRCNSALKVLNTCTEEQIADLEVQKAEMRVLRAHFFFELCRLFKQIPYFDENVDINAYDKISNTEFTRDEILGKIAKDLTDAAEVLPEKQNEVGRVNKYVAYAYAAKVKLYQAYRQDDKTNLVTSIDKGLLEEVVELCSKLDGKYDLLDDFQKLDLVQYENGVESVFAVQFSMNDGSDGAGCYNKSNLLNAPQGPYSGDGFFLPSQNLINAFKTDADGLPLFTSFNDTDYDVIEFDEAGNAVNKNVDATVDPRLDFIVGRPNVTWKTYRQSPCQTSWIRNSGDYGYHCCKRFFVSPESPDMFQGWPWGASAMNWQIIRYADVLLWKAEALVEIGGQAGLEEARKIINRIRRRAANQDTWVKDFNDAGKYAANYKIGEYGSDNWTQDYAREAVRFETRLETAMEGERYFDLVRWGIAERVMTDYFNKEKSKRVYYSTSKFRKSRDEYLPISKPQYNFSHGLYKQNPGYGDF